MKNSYTIKSSNWWQFCAAEEAPVLPLMTFFDPETNFFEVSHNLSTFGDVPIWPHMPRMPQNELSAFSQITKKYFDKTESFKRLLRKNNHAVIFFKIKQMRYSKVSYFTSGVKFQKKITDQFEEHKKLGQQLNFLKFLVTGGL